jgi:hypothetical protein
MEVEWPETVFCVLVLEEMSVVEESLGEIFELEAIEGVVVVVVMIAGVVTETGDIERRVCFCKRVRLLPRAELVAWTDVGINAFVLFSSFETSCFRETVREYPSKSIRLPPVS